MGGLIVGMCYLRVWYTKVNIYRVSGQTDDWILHVGVEYFRHNYCSLFPCVTEMCIRAHAPSNMCQLRVMFARHTMTIRSLFHVILLAPKIWSWLLDLYKICGPLMIHIYLRTYVHSRVQKFPAWHTKAAPNGKCCEGYIVPSMVSLMYQLKSVLK